MSIFSKIFGSKATPDQSAAEPRRDDETAADRLWDEQTAVEPHRDDTHAAEPLAGDFVTALAMQLRGELDPALASYQAFAEQFLDDHLAPFFAATIEAGKGNIAGAAQSLRSLSGQLSSAGENISRAIALELVAQVGDRPIIKIPAVAEIIVTFAETLKQEGFLQEGAVCLEIAAGLVPDNAHVLQKLGDTLHDLRIYDYAESVLQEALKCAPNHWASLYTYAVLLQDLGRNDEAIACYEKAVKLYPDHVNSQNNYGAALMRANRHQEALAHCNLAAELDPSSPFVQINLGNIHLLLQEFDKARSCFSEAIALNDALAPAYFGLASVEQALGRDLQRVQELYLKTLEISPNIAEVHHALGNLLAGAADPKALAHFSAAAQVNNNLRNLHKDFGHACLLLDRREEALEHLKIALRQDPEDMVVQDIIAKLEAEQAV
jgi:tetratricopeptide (TPR) repeat protein